MNRLTVNQLIISNIIAADGRNRCNRFYWTGQFFSKVVPGGPGDTEGTQYWVTRDNSLYADDGVVVGNTYIGDRKSWRHIADQL